MNEEKMIEEDTDVGLYIEVDVIDDKEMGNFEVRVARDRGWSDDLKKMYEDAAKEIP
jgi:hypothetical protein